MRLVLTKDERWPEWGLREAEKSDDPRYERVLDLDVNFWRRYSRVKKAFQALQDELERMSR